MASELAIKMKFRKYTAEQLQSVIDNTEATEVEISVAQSLIQKFTKEVEEVTEVPEVKITSPKPVKKKVVEVESAQEGDVVYEAKSKKNKTDLTEEEQSRLEEAEVEFEERQSKRKAAKVSTESTPRETKRQNLITSIECPDIYVGVNVTIDGGVTTGVIERIYVSGDGKEKCMIRFGDAKPVKKRVTAVQASK